MGRHDAKPPGDWNGFLAYAQQLRTPTIYDAIKTAERQDKITRFGFPASARVTSTGSMNSRAGCCRLATQYAASTPSMARA